MSARIDDLLLAQRAAIANRPAVQGFPYLAETLRMAGVHRNEWNLPSMQSLYLTDLGPVMMTGDPLFDGPSEVPEFNESALVAALRADQAGDLTFPEFALAAWRAGVVRWIVDLDNRVCAYHGALGESFAETYPGVSLSVGEGASN
jgi:uncharacterized protein YbcV (DUF1398 family)